MAHVFLKWATKDTYVICLKKGRDKLLFKILTEIDENNY
jgi:hypothetical protein